MKLENFYNPDFIEWLNETPDQWNVELELRTIFSVNWLKFYILKMKGSIKAPYQPHFQMDIDKCFLLHKTMNIMIL